MFVKLIFLISCQQNLIDYKWIFILSLILFIGYGLILFIV